jgi:hypothetical protein
VSDRDEHDLGELRFHWDGAYLIHRLGARWVAQRRDSRESFSAESADKLRDLIVADYTAKPVPRKDNGPWLP